MFEKGNYWGKLKEGGAITGESSTKKTPQVEIAFIVTHSASNGAWVPLDKPEERTLFLSLSDNAWQYTEKKLDALGFNGDFGNPVFKPEVYSDGVEFLCDIEVYDGKSKERWELAKWSGSREATPAGADVVRRLNAMWKSSRNATGRPAGGPSAPPAPKAALSVPPVPPPAPAAKQSATATAELVATTKEEAWKYVVDACGTKMNPTEQWTKAWADVVKDRHEDELTEADWSQLAEVASLPF